LSQLLEHHHRLEAQLEEGADLDALYLDFAKAFDKVDHGMLFRKLRPLWVGGSLLRWIHNFLTGRVQSVAFGKSKLRKAMVKSGVPSLSKF
jgi:hypothetical protein